MVDNARMQSMIPLYRAEQVREFDRLAIEQYGLPGYVLMQRAATASLQLLRAHWPHARRIQLWAGRGNNGGDAIDLARQALALGYEVDLRLLAEPTQLRGEAAEAWAAWSPVAQAARPMESQSVDLIVDGLFGSGLSRPLLGEFAEAVERINAAGRAGVPVLALDVPSGIQADSGEVLGVAVQASATLSFIGAKVGLHTGDGLACSRQRYFDALKVPDAVYEGAPPAAQLLQTAFVSQVLPPRRLNSHKGEHGHVLCIGGRAGYAGAIRLASEAALRSGAGLVSVATEPEHRELVMAGRPELMLRNWHDQQAMQNAVDQADVLLIGPGLGRDAWAQEQVARWISTGKKCVLDADALHVLPDQLPLDCVLTPHPGEAAHLLETGTQQIQARRYESLSALCAQYPATIVLKGAGSLIGEGAEVPRVCDYGNPGMAVAGMGDVLAGVIAALLAQGLSSFDAASAGVLVHAIAGDHAAAKGQRGLLAVDVINELRGVLNP